MIPARWYECIGYICNDDSGDNCKSRITNHTERNEICLNMMSMKKNHGLSPTKRKLTGHNFAQTNMHTVNNFFLLMADKRNIP